MITKQSLTFMLIDIDYVMKQSDSSPTIRLYGKTENQKILIKIKDFHPYFYITKKIGIDSFIANNKLISNWKQRSEEITKKRYFGGKAIKLIKLYGSHPEQTPIIRQEFVNAGFEIHEADIPFVKRFLLDTSMRGLNVISTTISNYNEEGNFITAEISYKDLKSTKSELMKSADFFYKLKIMAFDIEVDHHEETLLQLINDKKRRITAISYVFGTDQFNGKSNIHILQEDTDQAENEVITAFLKKLENIQPDVLITFNGDNFDLPYLLARMEKLGINSSLLSIFQANPVFYSNRYKSYRIKGCISYDISPRTWGIHPISGKKGLGDIAETILGKGKVDVDRPLGEIWQSGFINGNKEDQKRFKKYSLTDSELTYELAWKLGVPGWLEVIRLTGYPPAEAPGSTERILGEFELMRFAKMRNVLIPIAPSDEEVAQRKIERRKNPHTGGTVLNPKGTLHLGVIITDFRSMYPSVCVAHNIGGESLKRLKEIKNVNPLELFHSKPQSCLSLMQETLIQRREETKVKIREIDKQLEKSVDEKAKKKLSFTREVLDKEQFSMKIVANSMYGAHNYIRSRFYSITLGNAIADIARTYILRMEKLLESISKKVTPVEIIYGDTDSAFIKILDENLVSSIYNEKKPIKKQELMEHFLSLTDNILRNLNANFPKAMELTLEDVAYKLIFKPGRAKAYSYFSLLTNKLKITGFEAVRSDWSNISREAQTKVLELILKEPHVQNTSQKKSINDEDLGIKKAKEYLFDLGMKILQMPIDELKSKVIILSSLKRAPSKYKIKMPVVQAFLDYSKREGLDPETAWKDFDKFQWVITPGKGILSDRAKHPKYASDIDRDHYITEILRASEGFGLKISLDEIKNKLSIEPIDEIFKRIKSTTQNEEKASNEDKTDQLTGKKESLKSKQTKISKFFKNS